LGSERSKGKRSERLKGKGDEIQHLSTGREPTSEKGLVRKDKKEDHPSKRGKEVIFTEV